MNSDELRARFTRNAEEFDALMVEMLAQNEQLQADNQRLEAENATQRKGLGAVADLINESEGVTGLHLNGDIATWDELREGGRFEVWLVDFDAALQQERNDE